MRPALDSCVRLPTSLKRPRPFPRVTTSKRAGVPALILVPHAQAAQRSARLEAAGAVSVKVRRGRKPRRTDDAESGRTISKKKRRRMAGRGWGVVGETKPPGRRSLGSTGSLARAQRLTNAAFASSSVSATPLFGGGAGIVCRSGATLAASAEPAASTSEKSPRQPTRAVSP